MIFLGDGEQVVLLGLVGFLLLCQEFSYGRSHLIESVLVGPLLRTRQGLDVSLTRVLNCSHCWVSTPVRCPSVVRFWSSPRSTQNCSRYSGFFSFSVLKATLVCFGLFCWLGTMCRERMDLTRRWSPHGSGDLEVSDVSSAANGVLYQVPLFRSWVYTCCFVLSEQCVGDS